MEIGKFFCLTAIKDEAWVVRTTLRENEKVFSKQIYFDQKSTDGTQKIISEGKHSEIVQNTNEKFNERARVEALYLIAQRHGASRYINLDADEFLFIVNESNFLEELEHMGEDTSMEYEWLNIHPNGESYWSAGYKKFAATISGGVNVQGTFHVPRIPERTNTFRSQAAKVIHLQYLLPENIKEKQAWYILHEIETENMSSGIEIFRKYSHMWKYLCGENLVSIAELGLNKTSFAKLEVLSNWGGRLEDKIIQTKDIPIPIFARIYMEELRKTKTPKKEFWEIIALIYIKNTMTKTNLLIRICDKFLRAIGL